MNEAWFLIRYYLISLPHPLLNPISNFLSKPFSIELMKENFNSLSKELQVTSEKLFELFYFLYHKNSVLYSPEYLSYQFSLILCCQKGESVSFNVYTLIQNIIVNFNQIFESDDNSLLIGDLEDSNKIVLLNKYSNSNHHQGFNRLDSIQTLNKKKPSTPLSNVNEFNDD